MPSTVRLHRILTTKPDKVYRAFIEADALAKWLPPNGFTCTVHHLEAKVGGSHRMSFRNFTTGMSHSFGGEYLELVPGERLRYTDEFDDANLPGEMQVTVTLRPVSVRHRAEHRAGRHSRRHSGGGVLSRLAGVAAKPRPPRRARDQSVALVHARDELFACDFAMARRSKQVLEGRPARGRPVGLTPAPPVSQASPCRTARP
jgi:uncharacterized protein YndB with AHSA1/START domain